MSTVTGPDTESTDGKGARGIFAANVARNLAVCQDHLMIHFDIEGFPASVPGQFINIGPMIGRAGGPLQPARPLLKRPFSILSREDLAGGVARIGVLYRVLGSGTSWIGTLRPGDVAQVIGPLGRGFRVRDGMRTALLVGGGTGIAPLIYLATRLKAGHPHVRIVMFEGVRTKSLLPLRMDLDEPGSDSKILGGGVADVPLVIASDDGTVGQPGTVVEAVQRWIEREGTGHRGQGDPASPNDSYAAAGKETGRRADAGAQGRGDTETCVFACGPEPMMAAMAAVCERWGLLCQVSLEKSMACGMGTCQSCVVKVKDAADAAGWVYKLCCKDGPPFEAAEIVWG